jgi:uncharacterized membrane protein YbhN (UPF0104 family)
MAGEGVTRPLSPTERLGRTGPFILILSIVLVLAGLGTDFCMGLPLSLRARSPAAWVIGILGFGLLYLLAEAGIDWIGSKAQAPHPPWKRLLSALMLLGFLGTVCLAVGVACVSSYVRHSGTAPQKQSDA